MVYKKIAKLFESIDKVQPHSAEYYRLIRIADEELEKIRFKKIVEIAKEQQFFNMDTSQYKLF